MATVGEQSSRRSETTAEGWSPSSVFGLTVKDARRPLNAGRSLEEAVRGESSRVRTNVGHRRSRRHFINLVSKRL